MAGLTWRSSEPCSTRNDGLKAENAKCVKTLLYLFHLCVVQHLGMIDTGITNYTSYRGRSKYNNNNREDWMIWLFFQCVYIMQGKKWVSRKRNKTRKFKFWETGSETETKSETGNILPKVSRPIRNFMVFKIICKSRKIKQTHEKNTAKRNMSSAVCASSMYSRLCMKMSSFLFVRSCAIPRVLYLSCAIPFLV